ncbi:MAG TPA: hypothetical protein VK054_11690, partial [Beutenbergiaceae bacterium]|nr:hypothetical protein [Beutenbergiaceae bacterium]
MKYRHAAEPTRPRWRKLASLGAVAGLIATGLVTVSEEAAQADPPKPDVSASGTSSYIAGEDLEVEVSFSSAGDDHVYNLSAGVLLPEDVTIQDTSSLGTPRIFEAGETVPMPSGGEATADTCGEVGLDHDGHTCVVPDDSQYAVFTNISDLPTGATADHTLSIRPSADTFDVGEEIPVKVTGFTSKEERYIPVFPGTRSVAPDADHNSGAGGLDHNVAVNALRVEKSEPSPEDELLRGVHNHTTTYTVRVYHTGQGDISDAKVIDYLPAGLEYLGLGGVDNTENANGTRGETHEYPNAPELSDTPSPDGDPNTNALPTGDDKETVETVRGTFDGDGNFVPSDDGSGDVYTKVTWNMGKLAATNYGEDIEQGVAQSYPEGAGKPGYFEIRYRAGVPLFENTMDFGLEDGDHPGTDGEQAANLDNNRGASTRHGNSELGTENAGPNTYTNHAFAEGTYDKEGEDEGTSVSAHDSELIKAMDVRLLKTASGSGKFQQGDKVRYNLNIATSEYVGLEFPTDGNGAYERPARLVDSLADGICPVFPEDTPTLDDDGPTLWFGNPDDGLTEEDSVSAWNTAVKEVGQVCEYPSQSTQAGELKGALLEGIAFDADTGQFYLSFVLDKDGADKLSGPSAEHNVEYSAYMAKSYSREDRIRGATTSGDWVENTAEI